MNCQNFVETSFQNSDNLLRLELDIQAGCFFNPQKGYQGPALTDWRCPSFGCTWEIELP